MESLTKRHVTADELTAMARRGFGPDAKIACWHELTDGSYNAAYAVTLDSGVELVLKVAPPPALKLLSHEVDLMRTEVEVYRHCAGAGVPAPAVAFADFDRAVLGSDYTFLSRVPGTPLDRAELTDAERSTVRRQAAALSTHLHAVTGARFGYPLRGSASWQPTWRAAFGAMTDDLIADAERLSGPTTTIATDQTTDQTTAPTTDPTAGAGAARSGDPTWAPLPESPERIRELMLRHADALDEVTRPALVHFDLWDGNIFVAPDPSGGWRVTGLIDAERAFYGDPVAELISMTLLREVDDVPEVLEGFADGRGRPLELTGSVRRRIALYRTYLYLIMAIECRTRGWADRDWIVEPLRQQLDLLAAGPAGR